MSDAPERIWAQDAEPSECDYTGGGWWDDECGHTQYPHMVEYVRADTITALQAENERLREEVNGVRPAELLSLLKGKHSFLTIGFNDDHACNYATAQEWHDEWGMYGGGNTEDRIQWASEDERLTAIAENSVWTIQWYPATPIGFCCVGASTFEAAARVALSQTGEDK